MNELRDITDKQDRAKKKNCLHRHAVTHNATCLNSAFQKLVFYAGIFFSYSLEIAMIAS